MLSPLKFVCPLSNFRYITVAYVKKKRVVYDVT